MVATLKSDNQLLQQKELLTLQEESLIGFMKLSIVIKLTRKTNKMIKRENTIE